jgi:hypothetical protein
MSAYIAFFDECGDHSLTKIDRDFPLFVLSAVIIRRDDYESIIIPEIGKFKMRHWDHEGFNLHSRDIRKALYSFAFLQAPEKRTAFLQDLAGVMSKLPFTLFITAIRKDEHLRKYGAAANNPYDVALTFTFERILHFMEGVKETRLPVIAEARGAKEDAQLESAFYRLMTEGTQYNSGERFKRLDSPITFCSKKNNICGTQIADLCAHPSARHILNPAQPNQAFALIQQRVYKRDRVSGWKVFP